MTIHILAFGVARDILDGSSIEIETADGISIADLKETLTATFPEFSQLRHFSIAVNQAYQADDFQISPEDEVVIIPPVSGG